ncbi:hypothetical protein NW768_008368 [Fusarium equiseti]|uniref:Apple domain-containing protein n=1 Tax=Fusarium equiseti TaxID=61235 RepID=A0ABQ8R6J1_FUSEQ|nr:hypothetical protein NW768_008368 [Fusarium equiseti]
MVQIKVFVAGLAAGSVHNVHAGACKPKPDVSAEALTSAGVERSSLPIETAHTAESSSGTKPSGLFGSSSTEIVSSIAATTTSLETTTTAVVTTTTASSTAPSEPACGVHGTCSPASPGCQYIATSSTRDRLYLGECEDLCKAYADCKSIHYNTRVGNCYLMPQIAQDSGFYASEDTEMVWYDNSCEIDKRDPDPICGGVGECDAYVCSLEPHGQSTLKECHEGCLASDECESFTYVATYNGCFFNKKSLFKAGFYAEEGYNGEWYDNACIIEISE